METKEKKAPVKWEYKDRNYYLVNGKNPLTMTIPSRHSRRYPLLHFDENLGYQRELRYASNQQTPYVDEQKGEVTLAHVVFHNGHLLVPKEKRNLQEFLAIHPHKDIIFSEFDAAEEAEDHFDHLETEIEAMNLAYEMEIDEAEAVLRVEVGSDVTKLSSKEIRRDVVVFAKRNPQLFLDLAEDDNLILRNFAIKATEQRIIKLAEDQRTFSWASNGRKLLTVGFDENAYSAIAAWFKTDEGLEVYKSIEKKIK